MLSGHRGNTKNSRGISARLQRGFKDFSGYRSVDVTFKAKRASKLLHVKNYEIQKT